MDSEHPRVILNNGVQLQGSYEDNVGTLMLFEHNGPREHMYFLSEQLLCFACCARVVASPLQKRHNANPSVLLLHACTQVLNNNISTDSNKKLSQISNSSSVASGAIKERSSINSTNKSTVDPCKRTTGKRGAVCFGV